MTSYGQASTQFLQPVHLSGVDDDQPVFSLVDRALDRAGRDAGRVVAVLAQQRHVVHLDLGHGPADVLDRVHPELARVGLGFGDGRPVVADVLVFADELAGVAADAVSTSMTNTFIYSLPSSIQASKRSPAPGRSPGRRPPGDRCARLPIRRS